MSITLKNNRAVLWILSSLIKCFLDKITAHRKNAVYGYAIFPIFMKGDLCEIAVLRLFINVLMWRISCGHQNKMPWQEKKACANDAIYNNWKGNLQIDELFPLTERDTFSIINPAVKKRTLHISFSTSNQFVVRRGGFCGVGRRSCGEGSWNHDFAWFLWGYAHGKAAGFSWLLL